MTDNSSLTYSFNGRYISQRLTARIFDFRFRIPCTNFARLHLDVLSQIPFTFELATLFNSCVGYDIEFTQKGSTCTRLGDDMNAARCILLYHIAMNISTKLQYSFHNVHN
jgi:hypothetical protein